MLFRRLSSTWPSSIVQAGRGAALASLAALGVACTGQRLNTGAIDYRLAAGDGKIGWRYFPPQDIKDLPVLRPNDSLAIKIEQAFICGFSERSRAETFKWIIPKKMRSYDATPCDARNSSFVDTRGEIAVIADIFELGGERTIEHRTGTDSAQRGRLVYYSEDVRETGQFLNFSNVPLFGPARYGGRPVYVRIYVLELDNEEASRLTTTLTTLANAGKTVYAPASQVLDLLRSLGSAFLSGNQDDLEFEYEFTFDGYGGDANSYAPLAVGTYVFLRLTDRDDPFPWDGVRLDPYTGRLIENGADNKPQDFRRATYFTVRVTRNEPALAQDTGQLFEEFRSASKGGDGGVDLRPIADLADEFTARAQHASNLDRTRAALGLLQSGAASSVEATQAWGNLATAICESLLSSPPPAQEPSQPRQLDPRILTREEIEYLAVGLYETASTAGATSNAQAYETMAMQRACEGSGAPGLLSTLRAPPP